VHECRNLFSEGEFYASWKNGFTPAGFPGDVPAVLSLASGHRSDVLYWATGEPYESIMVPEEVFMRFYDTWIVADDVKTGMLGIFTDQDEFIGITDYREMDIRSQSAILGIMIGDKRHWGQDYGTDAVRVMCRFLFRRFGLNRIQLDTWDGNERAVHVFMKAGFQIEGRLRQAEQVRGFGVTALSWGSSRSNLKTPNRDHDI
jgi:RimJ/RimL family protein N-acetyltransferase